MIGILNRNIAANTINNKNTLTCIIWSHHGWIVYSLLGIEGKPPKWTQEQVKDLVYAPW